MVFSLFFFPYVLLQIQTRALSLSLVTCGGVPFWLKLTAQLDESDGQMSMRPRKRAREASASFDEASSAIRLSGGHAEKPRTVEAYREGQFVDVEIRSADGLSYRAHGLVAESGRGHSLKGVS